MENNRVLIVDDNPKNIQVIGTLIRKMGLPVSIAMNGEQALKILEKEVPALILSDIMMPEMDGFEFCRRVKHNFAYRDIPIIFLTASNDDEHEVKGLEMGAVDFIRKPINPPVLIARVNTHINLQHAMKELEKQNELLHENARLKEEVERMTRHDLKNPLQAVIGIPGVLMMDDNLTGEQIDLLRNVQSAGFNMLEMIDKSLDIYKMEVGTYHINYQSVDLVAVANKIRNYMTHQLSAKGLSYSVLLNGEEITSESEIFVDGEELLFYSMLSNLVKNAIEASPPNEEITTCIEKRNGEVEISIENSGEVSMKIAKTFFDKYSTSGKVKGTGLGTYSAKLIAQTLHGTIHLDLSHEKHVRVIITVPVQKNA